MLLLVLSALFLWLLGNKETARVRRYQTEWIHFIVNEAPGERTSEEASNALFRSREHGLAEGIIELQSWFFRGLATLLLLVALILLIQTMRSAKEREAHKTHVWKDV